MVFDLASLYFASVLFTLAAGFASVLFASRSVEFRSVRDWGTATLCIAAGMALVVVRAQLPNYFIAVSDGLLVLGIILTYRSFLVFFQRSTRDWPGILLLIVAVSAALAWQADLVSERIRSAMITGIFAVVMWRIVWLLYCEASERVRVARITAMITYILFSILSTVRTLAAIGGVTNGVLDRNAIELIYVSSNSVLWLIVTLSVIWMVVERQQADLSRLALYDPLTGALNRLSIEKRFYEEFSRIDRNDGCLAVLMVDIDHFKRVNDNYGHQVGDEVLKTLVERLRSVIRGHDSVGRYGGEEFVVLVNDADLKLAMEIAERARQTIAGTDMPVVPGGIRVTISVGVALCPEQAKDWSELIGLADAALYKAKASGRNRVELAAPEQAPESESTNLESKKSGISEAGIV